MKKFLLSALTVLLFGSLAMAQSSKQVNWNATAKKTGDKTYEVTLTANIGAGFHMYSQNVGGDGPIATSFTFTKSPLYTLSGKTAEQGKLITVMEKAWGHNVNYYEGTVSFVQVVKTKTNAKAAVKVSADFMVCNDHECLPPSTVELSVPVGQ